MGYIEWQKTVNGLRILQRERHIVFGWRVRRCNKSMSPSPSRSLCLSSLRCYPAMPFSFFLPFLLTLFLSLSFPRSLFSRYRAANSLKSRAPPLYLFPNKLNETHRFALVSINFLLLRSFVHSCFRSVINFLPNECCRDSVISLDLHRQSMEIYKLKWNYFILHLTLIHQSVILSRDILPCAVWVCFFVFLVCCFSVVSLLSNWRADESPFEAKMFSENRGNMSVSVPLTRTQDTTSIIILWICGWRKKCVEHCFTALLAVDCFLSCRTCCVCVMPFAATTPSTFLSPASTSKLIYGKQLLTNKPSTRDAQPDIFAWLDAEAR